MQPSRIPGGSVLVITIDTLRRDRVGAFGGPAGLTPALDRLTGNGIRFSRAYSHVPMTLGVLLAEHGRPADALPYLRRFVNETARQYARGIAHVDRMLRTIERGAK